MKSIFFFLFLVFTQILWAQNFTEKTGAPFDGVYSSSIAFADVDGDNDLDVLIMGLNSSGARISKLYINDGAGRFTERPDTPFEGVSSGSIAFADVDGDGHEDLLITGANNSGANISKLYINDGSGQFTERPDTPFEGVAAGSIAFADVNGDGHEDLLITGQISSFEYIAKLYINDGAGNFSEVTGTPFDGVQFSSIAFADVDGDNDSDLLITGQTSSLEYNAKLYINDGTGQFTERIDTPFEGVYLSSVAFADVDGNNDPDVLITGENNSGARISKLYINDGAGQFTERTDTPFDPVAGGSVAFSDVNGDGYEDLIITGRNSSSDPITNLYSNDGTGDFTERTDTPFDRVMFSSIAFADVDGDNYPDLLITGRNNSNERIAKLYIHDGMVSSTDHLSSGVKLELIPYPNPTSSNRVNVRFESEKMGFTTFNLYDVNGHLLREQKEFTGIGKQTISIDITSLSPGSYFIQLDKGKRKGTATFVVQ